MKILIAGGHLTPALAFIDYLQVHQPTDQLVFVGRVYSQSRHQQKSHEQAEVNRRKVLFVPFQAPRWSHSSSIIAKLLAPIYFIKAIVVAYHIFSHHQPDVFLSFGGYLAVPLAVAAKLHHRPVITHEQTLTAGLANQIIGRLATRVAVTFNDSTRFFPATKTQVTGNPLRPEALAKSNNQPSWLESQPQKPVLLITAGNQGSRFINQLIEESLPDLTTDWLVIHLCGAATPTDNYAHNLQQAKRRLPTAHQKNYVIKEWVSGDDLSWIYTHARAAVARAGANTMMELAIRRIPTVFIPLPHSRHQEQQKNARFLVSHQAALILNQHQATSTKLIASLGRLRVNHRQFQAQLDQVQLPTDAAARLNQLIKTTIKEHEK